MDGEEAQLFHAFVASRSSALLRLGYVLTGDQHSAEDLLQTALTKTVAKWPTIRHADPEGYVRKVMYNEQVSVWRRWGRRRETGPLPEPQGVPDLTGQVDLGLRLREALSGLTPKQRTVLVLRYYEDLTEAQVAVMLGISVGTVRSQTYKALARLRALTPDLAFVCRGGT